MLTIPEGVKSLLNLDGARRNFRVHFPNGEHADLTNADVDEESVTLTESICSDSELKFGLCECPVIEFETHGVGKIKGYEIECTLEFDVTDFLGDGYYNKRITVQPPLTEGTNTEDVVFEVNKYVKKFTSVQGTTYSTDGTGDITYVYDLGGVRYTAVEHPEYIYSTSYGCYVASIYCPIYGNGMLCDLKVSGITSVKNSTRSCYGAMYAFMEVYEMPEGSEKKNDLDYPTYPIKLGTFKIDSCKKQADMTRRKVVAYGKSDFQLTQESKDILSDFWWANNDVTLPIEAVIKMVNPSWNEDFKAATTTASTYSIDTITTSAGDTYRIQTKQKTCYVTAQNSIEHVKQVYDENFINEIKTFYDSLSATEQDELKDYGFNYISGNNLTQFTYNGSEKTSNLTDYGVAKPEYRVQTPITKLFQLANSEVCFPRFVLTYYAVNNSSTVVKYITDVFSNRKYGINGYPDTSHTGTFYVPVQVSIKKNGTEILNTDEYDNSATFDILPISKNVFEVSADLISLHNQVQFNLFLPGSSTTPSGIAGVNAYVVDYSGVIDRNWNEYLEAYCELQGGFGQVGRDGKFKILGLHDKFTGLYPSLTLYPSTDLYPNTPVGDTLGRSNYISLWYDDDETLPYGRVICTYNKDENTTVFDELYLPGFDSSTDKATYATYSISRNALVDGAYLTHDQVMSILNTIAGNISGVTYMPSEISMVGRPDIEAGDVLEIYSAEGAVTTIVMKRTLKGIDYLIDDIEST